MRATILLGFFVGFATSAVSPGTRRMERWNYTMPDTKILKALFDENLKDGNVIDNISSQSDSLEYFESSESAEPIDYLIQEEQRTLDSQVHEAHVVANLNKEGKRAVMSKEDTTTSGPLVTPTTEKRRIADEAFLFTCKLVLLSIITILVACLCVGWCIKKDREAHSVEESIALESIREEK